jgi:hypothetical protein
MRKIILPVLVACSLLIAVAGSAAANCGGDHADTVSNPPPTPAPQT